MSKQRKSEFPTSRLGSARNLTFAAATLVVVGGGLAAAQLMGLINLPGLPHHVAGEDNEAFKYEATVTVGPGGFEPAVLSVKPMTRVYFENHDQANHKVDQSTSAPDSTFGSPDEIVPSGGYAFTFVKSGDYKFHDGDSPTSNGEVIVQ